MKKIIALILCICICFSVTVMPVSANSEIITGIDDADFVDGFLKYFLGMEFGKDDNEIDAENIYEKTVEVSLSSVSVIPNSNAIVSLSLTKNKGIGEAKFVISYNTYDVNLIDVTPTTNLLSASFVEYYNYAIVTITSTALDGYDVLDYTGIGEIAKLTFAAKQASGEYALSFSDGSRVVGAIGDSREVAYADGKITVSCDHSFPSTYVVIKDADCINPGIRYKNCTICGWKQIEETAPKGHTAGDWRVYAPATCVAPGFEARFCRDCDTVLETRSIDIIEHSMGWGVTKEPTCSENGEKTYMCIICGGERGETQSIQKTNHIPGEKTVTKEPTCAEEGIEAVICKYCPEVISFETVEKLPHANTRLEVITAPTSENEGSGEYICTECGEVAQTVTFDKVEGIIHGEDVSAYRGDTVRIPVAVDYNNGFSYGIVRISYDKENLEFLSVTSGDVTQDITVGTLNEGEVSVLLCPADEESRTSGVLFYVEFKVTEEAESSFVDIYYNPGADFCDKYGQAVFFNFEGVNVTVNKYKKGDVDGDNIVDVTDLALMKLFLVGANDKIGEGADIDGNGIIDVTDLAFLKLHLAGSYVIE